jgi:predicted peroxiredoxin
MRNRSRWFALVLTAVVATIAWPASADNGRQLFVNLTSDEPLRAGMAVGQALKARRILKIPVVILLSVEGVRLADTRLPSPVYPSGKPVREMLKEFMAAGGQVLICPMCMKNVAAIPREALLEGVRIGGPDVTFPALFAEGTRTLSY